MKWSSLSKGGRRRIIAVAVALFALAGQAWASWDGRCVDCGFCSAYAAACGMCIVEAVQTSCPTWRPGAYAECDHGTWFVYCNG